MYIVELYTKIDLGNEKFVKSLLNDWYYQINPKLRPERFGQGEPVRKKFEEHGVGAAVELWLKDKLPLMLKRISAPKFEVDISGYKAAKTESKQYPSSCTVWLNFKAGDNLTLELFKFLVEKFKPGFAFITTEDDQKDKHYIEVETKIGTCSEYIGLDVGEKLPGIYWVTYFSEWAINKFETKVINDLNAFKKDKFQNGYIIQLFQNSSQIGSQEARNLENNIIQILGKDHFFKKPSFDENDILKDFGFQQNNLNS